MTEFDAVDVYKLIYIVTCLPFSRISIRASLVKSNPPTRKQAPLTRPFLTDKVYEHRHDPLQPIHVRTILVGRAISEDLHVFLV